MLHQSLPLVLAMLCCAPGLSRGQQVLDEENKPKGFSLGKEDAGITNALEDFDRYAEKKEWEKAFRAVSTIADATPKGLVLWKDGLMIPTRQRLMQSLVTLPPEGRQAFKLFFNPKAKQLYDGFLGDEAGKGSADEEALRKLVDTYFVTDTGDDAADHLGDLYFESGQFSAAAGVWGTILERYPETDLSLLRLEVKRAAALARAGQRACFDEAAARIREKYPNQSLTIGGHSIDAGAYLAQLRGALEGDPERPATQAAPGGPQAAPGSPQRSLHLPSSDRPLWQVRFGDDTLREQVQTLIGQGWWVNSDILGAVPASATDGERAYVNWIGVCFAIDIRTGKLLWRTDKFTDLAGKARELVQSGVSWERYAITTAGSDRVLYIRLPLDKLQQGNEPYRLVCVAAETGAVRWTSERGTLSNWSFSGRPVLMSDGQTLLAIAGPRGQGEISLLAINFANGQLLWSMPLGTPQAGQNRRGEPDMPIPVLLEHEGMLYVVTGNGAVIAVRPDARRIEWALTYEPPPQQGEQQMIWWNGMPQRENAIETPTAAILDSGTLYFKEHKADTLYALDLSKRALAWKRPVEPEDMLVGVSDSKIYILGNELSALDRGTRAMLWSTRVPLETGALRPILAGDHVYILSSRGVYEVNVAQGDVAHILRSKDTDAIGGALWVAGDRLVSVSNAAVTAYPLAHNEVAGSASAAQVGSSR